MSSIDRLALPRRHRVFDEQLLPSGDTLPYWTILSLDSKLPAVPSPRGAYTLTTTEVGTPKYRTKQRFDFDLSDPLGYKMKDAYNALHDPYLKEHFEETRNRKHLVKNGLVTSSGKVVCDLKEFNSYREYLHHRNATLLHMSKGKDQKRLHAARKNEQVRREKTEADNNGSGDSSYSSYGSLTLVEKIRRREAFLSNQLEEKRNMEAEEHARRVQRAWEERKRRQEEALKKEASLGSKYLHRERSLAKHWEYQIARKRAGN
ncbi:fibrous sheath-interacting protein 2-like [Gigantopelta aegis]|uniref:fibrous sheath-interacting protein 2-like n=1 Tax=Gigantopelta aegis TaxID=1735272 RepID=UPI001B88ACC1|nr:fibrous sheath-interacting protein 2-like [Gigantopelta aegis]